MPSERLNSVSMSTTEIANVIRGIMLTRQDLTPDERETIRTADFTFFGDYYASPQFFCFHHVLGKPVPEKNAHLGIQWSDEKLIEALTRYAPCNFFKGKHPSTIRIRTAGIQQYEFFPREQLRVQCYGADQD